MRNYRNFLENRLGHNRGRSFGECFGLDGVHVYVTGKGGLFADSYGLGYIEEQVSHVHPHILVLDIGTNDLTSGISGIALARIITDFIRHIVQTSSVRYVVLCQVVRRYRTRGISHTEFDDQRLEYNYWIQQQARRYPRLFVYKHERQILVNLHGVSSDDIHVTSSRGMRLYHFSMRKAIVYGLHEFRRLTA